MNRRAFFTRALGAAVGVKVLTGNASGSAPITYDIKGQFLSTNDIPIALEEDVDIRPPKFFRPTDSDQLQCKVLDSEGRRIAVHVRYSEGLNVRIGRDFKR